MDYSSSEDDELIEDYIDLEDDLDTSDVDQHAGEVNYMDQSEHSLAPLEHTDGAELFETGEEVRSGDPYLGMEFASDSAARNFYNAYALRLGFGIRVARSRSERRKGVELLVMKRFVCLKEGHHKKKVTEPGTKKKRKRLSIRDGCPAMMEVVRRGPDRWVITKLVLEHTHVVVSTDKVREIQLSRMSGKEQERAEYLRTMRHKIFGEGDAQGLLEFFKQLQAVNWEFFYAMQVDCRNCLTNVFWADAKARLAYTYFGDAVIFDTTYSKNENMMPIASFSGVNNHGHSVSFGCALLIDKTESSLTWLFETWLTAMLGREPLSLTTDQGKAIGAAFGKVFTDTRHRLCKWRILSRCKKQLPDLYSRYPGFHNELKQCITESVTVEAFEMCWSSTLGKYHLGGNTWLQSMYNSRHRWVPAYQRNSFFAELSPTHRPETMNSFFRKNIGTKTSLQAFIAKFEEVMDSRYEKENREDLEAAHVDQFLKTNSPMERQVAEAYTRTIFDIFQAELIEALGHCVVNIQEGPVSKFSIVRNGNTRDQHVVVLNASDKKAFCSCYKFEFSGVLCRHVLAVFWVIGITLIPGEYILKRWMRKAKYGLGLGERGLEIQTCCQNSLTLRYNDLFRDAIKCAEKGAISADTYKIAKDVLQKAFDEIVGFEESLCKVEQPRSRKS